jgi:hypothetical protein
MPSLPTLNRFAMLYPATFETLRTQFLRFQEVLSRAVAPLLAHPRALSNVHSVSLTAGVSAVVSHRLPLLPGKTPSGWKVIDIDEHTTPFRVAWDSKTITLEAAVSCNVRFEVW